MNKRHTEYIALYLFVFGAILLFGVMVRKFIIIKGYDEFSAAVAFFATVIVLSALYISLQMTLNELLLPRMEKFLMRFPASISTYARDMVTEMRVVLCGMRMASASVFTREVWIFISASGSTAKA